VWLASALALVCVWAVMPVPGSAVLAQARSLAIVGGTVIDVVTGTPRPNTNVIVTNGRIARVGPAATTPAPGGAQVIDATGKYVVPGLWDAHIHYRDYYAELLFSYGITSFIDWGGSTLDWTLAQREGINAGKIYGPRLFTAGGTLGENLTPEQARARVRDLKAAGVDMITMGFSMPKESVFAAIDEAQKLGLPSSGYSVYMREAIEHGLGAIKHTYTVGNANVTDPAKRAEIEAQVKITPQNRRNPKLFLLGEDIDGLVKLMVEKKTVWIPTFVKDFKAIHDRRDEFELENYRLLANPQLQYLPVANLLPQIQNDEETGLPDVASGFVGTVHRSGPDWELYRRTEKNLMALIGRLAREGGRVLPGTAPHSYLLPGLSLHQELLLFVDSGMTPALALRSATLWPAEYMKVEKDYGSITEGKVADIVIVKQDPLADIKNLRQVDTVIQGGAVQPTGYHWYYTNPLARTGGGAPGEGPRPPEIASITPSSMERDAGADLPVTIRGRGFVKTSVVFVERMPVPTTYVSPTELKAVVPASVAKNPGTYFLRVRTPRPGGGASNDLPLTVKF
jgi:hypothetical protein